MLKYKLGVCLLISLLLPGCLGGSATRLVTPISEPNFKRAASLLKPAMLRHNIIDNSGAWERPRFIRADADGTGQELLNRLSPTFRYPSLESGYQGKSIKQTLMPDARVSLSRNSFTLVQGSDRMTVSLMALLDWNGDGVEDWFVSAKVEALDDPAASREYFLIIDRLQAPVWAAKILGVHDCRLGICQMHLVNDSGELPPNLSMTDIISGEYEVTAHPDQLPGYSGNGGLEENSLSQ